MTDEIEYRLKTIREATGLLVVPFARKEENRLLEHYLFGQGISSPRFMDKFFTDVAKILQTAEQLYQLTHGRLARLIDA